MNRHGFFITGTDTGIGKTHVTALLLGLFRRQGLDVGVMKPVETGVDPECHSAANSDALFLVERAGVADAPDAVCPLRFRTPAAPWQAAEMENRVVDVPALLAAWRRLAARHAVMLVEGIGGVRVPLKRDYFLTDLMRDMGLPVILVAGYRLGTLNHTLLSVQSLEQAGLSVAGIVFNATEPGALDPVQRELPRRVSALTGLPILGQVPYGATLDAGEETALASGIDPGIFGPEFGRAGKS